MKTENTTQKMLDSARAQYRACFMKMAAEGVGWHLHHITGTSRVCLMREDAVWDIPTPDIVVANVHAMTEGQLIVRLAGVAPRLHVRGLTE